MRTHLLAAYACITLSILYVYIKHTLCIMHRKITTSEALKSLNYRTEIEVVRNYTISFSFSIILQSSVHVNLFDYKNRVYKDIIFVSLTKKISFSQKNIISTSMTTGTGCTNKTCLITRTGCTKISFQSSIPEVVNNQGQIY